MQLLDQDATLSGNGSPGRFLLTLTNEDLAVVIHSIQKVRRVIDDQEFRTRLGVEPAEADALIAALGTKAAEGKSRQFPAVPCAAREQAELVEVVAMTESDLLLINNALNEVLYGLAIDDMRPRAKATSLLAAVGAILDQLASGDSAARTSGNRYVDHLR